MSLEDGLSAWEVRAKAAHYRAGELADAFSVSEVTLRRRFRARFKRDLRVWLQELRLRRFKELVMERRPLKEIATFLGLKHESYLSWLFLRAVGVSMRKYRRAQVTKVVPALHSWRKVDEPTAALDADLTIGAGRGLSRFATLSEPARNTPPRLHADLRR